MSDENEPDKPICGIVMPISAMLPDYDANHWSDVRRILNSAIDKAGFTPQIVSDSFENDVIQNRIVQNLYSNDVVVCDVSGLNPNVMFEMGIRVTFNKPVIAVTDDFDSLPFDTKIIEHLKYPKDLHIHQTNLFIENLAKKIKILDKKFREKSYQTPLDSLGSFEVFRPKTQEVSGEKYIADGIDAIMRRLNRLEMISRRQSVGSSKDASHVLSQSKNVTVHVHGEKPFKAKDVDQMIDRIDGVNHVTLDEKKISINFRVPPWMDPREIMQIVENAVGSENVSMIELD